MLKEILIYAIVAASSLLLMTFVAHMLVGGLVSEQTEQRITIGLCALVACVIAAMAWDVARRRRRGHSAHGNSGPSAPRGGGES
jgi:Na+/melibiose symporter-like transporter